MSTSDETDRAVTYLPAEALDEMEKSEQKVPESFVTRVKELRRRFM